MKDIVLGKEVMEELRSVVKSCPPLLELEEAEHYVQESGDEVARKALQSFGST